MSLEKINVKVDRNLAKKILKIASLKFELRNIENHAEAVREALIEFIKNNTKYLKKSKKSKIDDFKLNSQEAVGEIKNTEEQKCSSL